MNKIHIIGIGFRPLGKKEQDVLLDSEVVLTNASLHEVFKRYDEYENVKDRILVHGTVYEMLDYIADSLSKKKIALIGAGDPMFFGIGRLVTDRFGPDAAEIYPDLSSMQVAFSRARVTENNALMISLHGGPDPKKRMKRKYDTSDLPRLLTEHGKMGVLTDKENNPSTIAREFCRGEVPSPSEIKMYVCERLGYDDEKLITGTPEEIAEMSFEYPNVVIVTSAEALKRGSAEGKDPAATAFGLREAEISHARGLITKDEVRAVTVHKLRLPRNGVMWDIGAGSGSVSIECALLSPGIDVYAVEKKGEQTGIIKENIEKFGAANITLTEGEAPAALDGLPEPDRVFIGGSGGEMARIIEEIKKKMRNGMVVVNAVTIETLNDAVHALEKNGFTVNISEVSVSRSKSIGTGRQMSALNPIFVISGELKQ